MARLGVAVPRATSKTENLMQASPGESTSLSVVHYDSKATFTTCAHQAFASPHGACVTLV